MATDVVDGSAAATDKCQSLSFGVRLPVAARAPLPEGGNGREHGRALAVHRAAITASRSPAESFHLYDSP